MPDCEKLIEEHKKDPLCDINLCAVVVLDRWKKPSLRNRLPQVYIILQQPKVSTFLVKASLFFFLLQKNNSECSRCTALFLFFYTHL